MKFKEIARIELRAGAGETVENGLCIMEMVSWFAGYGEITDHPKCASPAMADFCIQINDAAANNKAREPLKQLLPLLLDSVDPENEGRRAQYLAAQIGYMLARQYDRRLPVMKRKRAEFRTLNDARLIALQWRCSTHPDYSVSSRTHYEEDALAAFESTISSDYEGQDNPKEWVRLAEEVANLFGTGCLGPVDGHGVRRMMLVAKGALMLGKHGDLDPTETKHIERARELKARIKAEEPA